MCFSLAWIEQLLIWLVIVCAIVALLKLLLPFILNQLGAAGGIMMAAINIVVWAVVLIFGQYCTSRTQAVQPARGGER